MVSLHSSAISDVLQIGPNELVQFGGLLRLFTEIVSQAFHLVVERLTVVFNFGGSDVSPRCQDVGVVTDVFNRRRLAEPRYVLVLLLAILVATPCVVGFGNAADVGVAEFAVDAVNQRSQPAGVDEQRLARPLAEPTVPLA